MDDRFVHWWIFSFTAFWLGICVGTFFCISEWWKWIVIVFSAIGFVESLLLFIAHIKSLPEELS